jgi:hypothetical protein
LWSSRVKCPLFLLWIYGNHNPVTNLRNFIKFNSYYLQSRQIFWCPCVQDMCHT